MRDNVFNTYTEERFMRDSNMELLRIISMLMIVIHHFITQVNGGDTVINHSLVGGLINALCYVGVNCFILISGWFGIRVKWKGFLNLFLCCSFFGVISYIFHIINDGDAIGSSLLKWAFLPLSGSKWWFVNCYLILYLSAPLINLALKQISQKEYLLILGLFTLNNVYFGNIMQAEFFNQNGYSAAQMVYVYLIGGYLRRYVSKTQIRDRRWMLLTIYFVCSALWLVLKYLRLEHGIDPYFGTGYNNLFNLAGAICFFLYFSSFHFNSRIVNYIACSSFSVYLLQESIYFGRGWLYPKVGLIYESLGLGSQIVFMLLLSVSFYILVFFIDQPRKWIYSLLVRIIEPTKTIIS